MNVVFFSFIQIFQKCFIFSGCSSYTSSVKLVYNSIIVFHAVANVIVFIISILDCSLLVYRTAVDFCVLIFYPTTLWNSFINSGSFQWIPQDFQFIRSCHLEESSLSFPTWVQFCLSLHLPSLPSFLHNCPDKNSCTVLSSSDEGQLPCLVLELSLSPLSMLLTVAHCSLTLSIGFPEENSQHIIRWPSPSAVSSASAVTWGDWIVASAFVGDRLSHFRWW